LKLGQAVVYLGGETKNIVATGIVSSLNTKDIKVEDPNASSTASSTPITQTVVVSIQTTVPSANFIEGGLLFNLSGELVGMKSTYSTSERTDLFAPASDIKSALSDYAESQKKTQ
jgi:S1-C subfamily serine protease